MNDLEIIKYLRENYKPKKGYLASLGDFMEQQWNIKSRLVRCPYCKVEIMTDAAGPKCPKCPKCAMAMVTVISKGKDNDCQ